MSVYVGVDYVAKNGRSYSLMKKGPDQEEAFLEVLSRFLAWGTADVKEFVDVRVGSKKNVDIDSD